MFYIKLFLENIHWFQQTGSIIGYFCSLILQVQQLNVYNIVGKLDIKLPLVDYLLSDKERINYEIEKNPTAFGFPEMEEIDYVAYIGLDNDTSFGTKHILEGHARANDLLLIDYYYKLEPENVYLEELKKELKEGYLYYAAYQIFCDYAINPVLPPLYSQTRLYEGVLDPRYIVPQYRFMNIVEKLGMLFSKGELSYQKLLQRIEHVKLGGLDFCDISIQSLNKFITAIYEIIEDHSFLTNPIKAAQMVNDMPQNKKDMDVTNHDTRFYDLESGIPEKDLDEIVQFFQQFCKSDLKSLFY